MPNNKQGSGFIEGLKMVVLVVLVGFIAFFAGGVTTQLKVGPLTDVMQRTAMAVVYLYGSTSETGLHESIWVPTDRTAAPDAPIYLHDPMLAGKGLNLVVSAANQEATLMTMDGRTVHRWAKRYDQIWQGTATGDDAAWIENIYWRRVKLLDDGALLVVFETPSRTPYGLGLVKLDKDSNVVWKLSENLHHDTAVDGKGNIYALGQRINEQGYRGYARLKPPFIDDSIVFLSPDGKKLKEIFVVEAFLNSDYAPVLDAMPASLLGDPIHVNTVMYIDEETAAKFPFAKAGDLLISMREMSTIAVLDPIAEKIVWARNGPWRQQHEPVMLKNGNILIFDNQGLMEQKGRSRVIEFNPTTGAIDWSFDGTKDEPLISMFFGSQQRLANGNTLIVDTRSGRAVEVTPQGQVAWDYRTPHRKTVEGQQYVMPLFDLVRIDPKAATFLK